MTTAPRCRRFRFSLRTFFVVIVLLGVACAGVAREVAIVRERKAVLQWLQERFDAVDSAVRRSLTRGTEHMGFLFIEYGEPGLRKLLGEDSTVTNVQHRDSLTASEIDRIKAAFPEATVEPWPDYYPFK